MGDRRPPQKSFKAGKDRIKLTKNLQQLQTALQQRIANAASCKVACQQLCDCATHKGDNQMMIGRLGLLEDIQDAMQRHAKSAELQEAACRVVSAVGGHQSNCNKAAELLPDIKAALVAHTASPAVLEAACRAISVVCVNPKSREICGSLKMLSAIHKCIKAHKGNAGLQEAAFSAVSNVVRDTPATKVQAERLGLKEDIEAGMKAHGNVPKVVERGQIAIERCLAPDPEGEDGDVESDGIEGGGGGGDDDGDDEDEEDVSDEDGA